MGCIDSRMQVADIHREGTAMQCANCGAENRELAKFCKGCGKSLGGSTTSATVTDATDGIVFFQALLNFHLGDDIQSDGRLVEQ